MRILIWPQGTVKKSNPPFEIEKRERERERQREREREKKKNMSEFLAGALNA
jgi:hypothetical protein